MTGRESLIDARPLDVPLLCGHWTFFGAKGKESTARCDLPSGHNGSMHRFWTAPTRGESFTWNEKFERHEMRRDA